MNTNKLICTLLTGVALLAGGCSAQEDLMETSLTTEGQGNIRFRLGGAAQHEGTRTPAEDNEKRVETLYVLAWDQEDNSDCTLLQAYRTGQPDEWALNVEKDARYRMRFIANPDDDTVEELKKFKGTPGFQSNSGNLSIYGLLTRILTSQAPDGENFLMVSSEEKGVATSITAGTLDIGTITMHRLPARFDIVNKADGVTINSVTYNNRAIRTGIYSNSESWLEKVDDSWFEQKKVYDSTNTDNKLPLEGSREDEKSLRHTIYSYPNYATAEAGKLPSLTIEYTQVENGESVTRTHEVEFIDPVKENRTPLAIKYNTLYTIVVDKGEEINFNVMVADWEDTDEMVEDHLTVNLLDISAEEQRQLNERLSVNRFAPYVVKNLNINSKEFTFYDSFSADINDYSTGDDGPYIKIEELKNAKLLDDGTNTNEVLLKERITGDKYKIPNAGEWSLLIPSQPVYMLEDRELEHYINGNGVDAVREVFINFAAEKNDDNTLWKNDHISYPEEISFKNYINEKGAITMLPASKDPEALKSTFVGAVGVTNKIIYRNIRVLTNDEAATPFAYRPLYAIRFKGTSEYAAYKWEFMLEGNDYKRPYHSIKIKALPDNLNVSVFDIVNNDTYWQDGYIEYKIPSLGIVRRQSDNSYARIYTNEGYGYFLSSSYIQSGSSLLRPSFGAFNIKFETTYIWTDKLPLFLIKEPDSTSNP